MTSMWPSHFTMPTARPQSDSASAAAALQAAINAGNVKHWLVGPEVNEYDVVTTVNGGKLKVEFDIRAYADGTTSTNVIFDNSWMFSPGKTDQVYDVAISRGGENIYRASNVSQYLYSLWHYQVDGPGTVNPDVQYDVSYLLTAAALPAYDQTYGISNTKSRRITMHSTPPPLPDLAARVGNTEQWRYQRRFSNHGIICDIGVP